MSTDNAKFKVRNRTVEIKWVSQDCDHILSNYIHRNKDHDLKFLQISKLLKTCTIFEHYYGRTWYAYNVINDIKYRVVFILTPKFAVIKTCYRYGYSEEKRN
jgi:hypothetical protein